MRAAAATESSSQPEHPSSHPPLSSPQPRSADDALTFVQLPAGTDFGEWALRLAAALLPAEAEAAAWRRQV